MQKATMPKMIAWAAKSRSQTKKPKGSEIDAAIGPSSSSNATVTRTGDHALDRQLGELALEESTLDGR